MTEQEKYIVDRIYYAMHCSSNFETEMEWIRRAGRKASLRDKTHGHGLEEPAIIELVSDIEEIFSIEIDNDKAQKAQTVGDLINLVIEARKESHKE